MKKQVLVAAAQIKPVWMDRQRNIEIMENAIETCARQGADLVVFPELANIGYITGRDREFGKTYIENAERIPGPTTEALAKVARLLGIHVIVGIAEKHPIIPATLLNSAVLIDSNGDIRGVQRKIHIPGEEKHYFGGGHRIGVFQTAIANIGMVICYDSQFPEVTRTLCLKGAEIICMLFNMPTFSNDPELLEHLTCARAAENRVFVVSCNRVGTDGETTFFGHSTISGPVGNILVKANEEETVITAVLAAEDLYRERAFQPVFRDRRPELYSALCWQLEDSSYDNDADKEEDAWNENCIGLTKLQKKKPLSY